MPRRKSKPKRPRPPKPIGPEERQFIAEYLIDHNGTRAYLAVWPTAAYTTARTNAAKLLAKANIRAEVRAARDARQRRTRMRADTALVEAARLAYSDPLYIFEADGVTPRNIRHIPIDTRRAIASVKVRREQEATTVKTKEGDKETTVRTEYHTIEYKLWPKPKGLDKVFAHLGLATEIAPLDVLLASLPPSLAAQVRAALAGGTDG